MKVEILHVAGCPHAIPALHLVQKTLKQEGLKAEVQALLVETEQEAQTLRFSGSPTIRVDGEDVEPILEPQFSLGCRLYRNPVNPGLPCEEAVRVAICRGGKEG